MEHTKISFVSILGVRVDKVSMDQAVELVGSWLKKGTRHYIVTPNPEFIMLAQKDEIFRTILNQSDLAIPDGSRLGWANSVLQEKNLFKKFLIWLTFLFPSRQLRQFDTVTGVELMERLCKTSVDWGSTIGLLGGKDGVAVKTAECLQKMYPKMNYSAVKLTEYPAESSSANHSSRQGEYSGSRIKIVFAESGGKIDSEGRLPRLPGLPKIDILFVAFGQGKQEKWIASNIKKLPVKVMMGVGGSFDEISGISPRPPKWVSDLKLKWLFRLITEPWRIKRQLQLVKFLWKVLTK